MLIPSPLGSKDMLTTSLSRRVNANSQRILARRRLVDKLIKKGEC